MTDEQFRELRQLILDLAVRVERIELHLNRQDAIASHRYSLVYEWCAPPAYKAAVEAMDQTIPVGIPDDLKKFLPPKG